GFDAAAQVGFGLGVAAGGEQGLGEAEAEEGVVGLAGDQRGELGDAVGHQSASTRTRTPVRLSLPPRARLSLTMVSRMVATGWPESRYWASSWSGIMPVMPSVA